MPHPPVSDAHTSDLLPVMGLSAKATVVMGLFAPPYRPPATLRATGGPRGAEPPGTSRPLRRRCGARRPSQTEEQCGATVLRSVSRGRAGRQTLSGDRDSRGPWALGIGVVREASRDEDCTASECGPVWRSGVEESSDYYYRYGSPYDPRPESLLGIPMLHINEHGQDLLVDYLARSIFELDTIVVGDTRLLDERQ